MSWKVFPPLPYSERVFVEYTFFLHQIFYIIHQGSHLWLESSLIDAFKLSVMKWIMCLWLYMFRLSIIPWVAFESFCFSSSLFFIPKCPNCKHNNVWNIPLFYVFWVCRDNSSFTSDSGNFYIPSFSWWI